MLQGVPLGLHLSNIKLGETTWQMLLLKTEARFVSLHAWNHGVLSRDLLTPCTGNAGQSSRADSQSCNHS